MLAVAVCALARLARLDADRALYPIILMVVASYYVLFAAIDGRGSVVWIETSIAAVFAAVALIGFRRSAILVPLGLAAHGVFDAVHRHAVANTGVPPWWPAFCMAFDGAAAAVLVAMQIHRTRQSVHRDRANPPLATSLPSFPSDMENEHA
jgi:hypothetical protein